MASFILAGLLGAAAVQAQTPLASLRIPYNQIPYKADTSSGNRGPQYGYNQCNATTEGQNSLCQTAMINSIDDFCLWGPPTPGQTVGDIEGEMVAWCTKAGRGTRLIPAGALTGVQFMRTPSYVQVTGHINQQLIDMTADDSGGEMDPHGADARGNPIGGLVYSNQLPSARGTVTQVIEWHNFMGGGIFCLKACDPADNNAANYCQHIFDRIGCQYNAPAAYVDGTFESCLGENQDFPGVYTVNGVAQTYQQPPEALGPITSIPYVARIPASSSCTPAVSSAIYTDALRLASSIAANSSSAAAASSSRAAATAGTSAAGSTSSRAPAASASGTNGSSTGAASPAFVFSSALLGAAALVSAILVL